MQMDVIKVTKGREHILFKNERVISILQEAKKSRSMSKFVEDAVIFYLDNMSKQVQYVTREDVKDMLLEYLGQMAINKPICNQNTQGKEENLTEEIKDIMALGDD